jgi:hypothetical protein
MYDKLRSKSFALMILSGKNLAAAVLALLAIQTALVVAMVHRESLTWDEGDHMFAGYMMWKTADYGLNPEHPPLVKLLATIPTLHEKLWIPPLQGRFFKAEAYEDGRDWLARNDGASQRLVFRMRLSAGLLALGLALMVFFAAREWFGTTAALIALTLVVFDPNIMAHSASASSSSQPSSRSIAGPRVPRSAVCCLRALPPGCSPLPSIPASSSRPCSSRSSCTKSSAPIAASACVVRCASAEASWPWC